VYPGTSLFQAFIQNPGALSNGWQMSWGDGDKGDPNPLASGGVDFFPNDHRESDILLQDNPCHIVYA